MRTVASPASNSLPAKLPDPEILTSASLPDPETVMLPEPDMTAVRLSLSTVRLIRPEPETAAANVRAVIRSSAEKRPEPDISTPESGVGE